MKLTVEDVTELFGVSEKTVYRWIKSNGLPAFRVNNQYRFNRTDLLEWASSHRVNVTPQLVQATPASGPGDLPTLTGCLMAGGIHYRVSGRNKSTVLASVVELLRLPDDVDRDSLLQILLAREEMGSTAVGDGIAIPHPRNPIVLNITQPRVSLCFLERAVDFDALDGVPVTVLFTLISPTTNAHLHLLSRLAFVLRNDALKHALATQASREGILECLRTAEAAIATAAKPADAGTGNA